LGSEGREAFLAGDLRAILQTRRMGDIAQLSWRQRFDIREHFERVKSVVAEANKQNLNRLAAELKKWRE